MLVTHGIAGCLLLELGSGFISIRSYLLLAKYNHDILPKFALHVMEQKGVSA